MTKNNIKLITIKESFKLSYLSGFHFTSETTGCVLAPLQQMAWVRKSPPNLVRVHNGKEINQLLLCQQLDLGQVKLVGIGACLRALLLLIQRKCSIFHILPWPTPWVASGSTSQRVIVKSGTGDLGQHAEQAAVAMTPITLVAVLLHHLPSAGTPHFCIEVHLLSPWSWSSH